VRLLHFSVLALLLPACGGESAPRPRNLVFLCVDTLRWDHLGAYGDERPDASPAIDSLAASSVVFEDAQSHASWTLPSFAAVLTSTYTSTNGCSDLESRLKESFVTLPEIFRDAGFDTFGVASHIFFREEYGFWQGFDAFDATLAHKRGEEGWRALSSPYVTERALAFLDQRRADADADPFLLWLHYFDPHLPYVDHDGVGVEPGTEHERYRAEIAYTDGFVGEVLAGLERNGHSEDTVVVFLSDHGEAWQEHAGVRRHAKSLYREELQVPLILHVPGVAPRRVTERVRTVDLLPTLLELFGLEHPLGMLAGRSLVPLLGGASLPEPRLLAEIELHADQRHRRALFEERWKLIEAQDGSHLLFDVDADPEERHDLAASEPAVVARLRSLLEEEVDRARMLGELFEGDGSVELSQEDLDRLHALGYGGE